MENEKKVKIVNIIYQQGNFYLSQGAPGYQAGKVTRKDDTLKINRGTGWYEEKTPSKLFIGIENNGKSEVIEIANYFHKNIGKITQKRLERIKQLKGAEIEKKNNASINDTIIDAMKDKIK
ncbi:MAG: hypothetical protein LBU19_05205 [Treponema sp.]|jgi:hypothetical protein|nr:hypothetical protein [Treponema sp.]